MRPTARFSRAPWYVMLLAGQVLLAVGILGQRAATAWQAYEIQWAQDMAFFHQIFHAAAEGRAWTSSLLLEPTGFLQMVHFHPIFALLMPLYLLYPAVTTLLGINVAAVVAGAIPLAGLARDRTGSPAFGLAMALAFLLWLPVQAAALRDFEPMAFFVPGFLWLLHGAQRRSWARLALGAGLVFLAREESCYLVGAMGAVLLILPFGGPRRREGMALLAAGGAWFVTLLLLKGNFFFHFNPANLLGGGEGGTTPDPALTAERFHHMGMLLLGGYLPSLLSPAALASCLGPLGYLFSAPGKEWHAFTGPYAFYRDALIPFLAAGGVMGWAWLADRFPRHKRAALATAATLAVLGNALAFWPQRQALRQGTWERNKEEARSPEKQSLDALIAQVAPDARVATDYKLIAHVSGRRVLWNVNHMYLEDGRPPWWTAEWPLTLDRVDTVLIHNSDPFIARLDDAWVRTAGGAGYGLWRRTQDPEGGFPEPLP